MTDFKVAETLRTLRCHLGLTQDELSKKLKISRQTYSAYESGSRVPSLELSCMIASYFDISLDKLVFGLDYPENWMSSLPADYQELLNSYTELSFEAQQELRTYMYFLKSREK